MGDLSPIEPDGLGIEGSMELMVIDDELGTALVGTEDAHGSHPSSSVVTVEERGEQSACSRRLGA